MVDTITGWQIFFSSKNVLKLQESCAIFLFDFIHWKCIFLKEWKSTVCDDV